MHYWRRNNALQTPGPGRHYFFTNNALAGILIIIYRPRELHHGRPHVVVSLRTVSLIRHRVDKWKVRPIHEHWGVG